MRLLPRALAPAALVVVLSGLAARGAEPARTIDYQRDVRPILADKCFTCHGPDDAKREAGLRLDSLAAATRPAESGERAIVPKDPEASELLFRVTADDATLRMPPAGTTKTVSPAEAETLRAWIAQGAVYTNHWAFTPPSRPALPEVKGEGWVRNPIDRFVLARLEKEGLAPAPEADRTTLLRRLALDLTGLPPTPSEVDAFVKDARGDAYEAQVQRLLRSPHYGERWARLWLDAARYADSDGYEKDKARNVHFYRDWVVNAFNRDLPYSDFLIDQVAGDLRESPTQDQLVATGFLRNSMINEEGGVDPEQFRMEAMFDRMDAIGTGMLGLTIRCAQCHTHKYDPITHSEYYRMFAFLNDSFEGSVAVYTPEELQRRAEILRETTAVEADLQHRTPDWPERMQTWEAGETGGETAWEVVRPELDTSGGQKHYLLEDGSILASGYAPTKHTTEFAARTDLKEITAARLELLNDPNLPLQGPGRSPVGLLALTEFKVTAAPADHPEQAKQVKVVRATADVNPPERPLEAMFDDKGKEKRVTGPVAYAVDGKNETAWGIDVGPGRSNVPRQAVFVFAEPIRFEAGAVLTFKLTQNHGGWNSDDNQNNNLGRFRFAVTGEAEAAADPVPASVREILAIPAGSRTPSQVAQVFRHWRTTVPEWDEANARIEALWASHPKGSSQLVLQHGAGRKTNLLERGDFLKPAAAVEPGVPEVLNPLPADAKADRMTFARWLADPKTPTPARAIVNRIWQAYFGTGLVATAEDFGLQGEAPSHPELLDWLAVELVESGWSLKHLHTLIVTSATYRQSSKATPELLKRDPYNRLLARGARFRLDAELVRDVSLAASGLLDATLGGPSVYPPAPAFLFEPPASYGPKVWREATGPDRYRRALYTFRFRSVPYPMLQAFDAPNGDAACVRRSRSNTPLQALTTLNEPLFLEAARALARATVTDGGACDETRLTFAFRRCVSRPPTAAESRTLLDLLASLKDRYAQPGADPWALAADDPAKPPTLPEGVAPADLAAWTAVARVLLNLDETITRE
jgi:hypothetical protein